MIDAHYPLQALLYGVALHRFLRWRLPDYDPERHLGGVALPVRARHVRPGHPVVDGAPCGVFGWAPPPALIVALSDLLHGGGPMTRRPRRPPPRPHRRTACSARSTRRACSTRPTCTSPAGSVGSAASPTSEVLLAAALAVRAARLGSVCVDLAAVHHTVLGEGDEPLDVSALPWPSPPEWLAACRAGPARRRRRATAPSGRPLRLVDGLLYLERFWGEEELVRRSLAERAALPPPVVDLDAAAGGARHALPGAGGRPAAARRGGGRAAARHRARGRSRHRARPPPWRGCWRCSPSSPARRRASRWPRPPARPPPGCRRPSRPQLPAGSRGPGGRRRHPAPAAGLAARRHVPLRPRRAAALRRRRGGRDVDGVAADDGPAARRGAPPRPARAGRRPRPAGVGRGRCRARRPRARRRASRARARRRARPPSGLPTGRGQRRRHARARLALRRHDRRVRPGRAGGRRRRRARAAARGARDDLATGRARRRSTALRADVVAAGSALAEAAAAGGAEAALAALERHRVLCAHRRGPFGVARWSAEVDRWLAPTRGRRRPLVPGAGGARHRQRLRHRPLQRRHRRRRRHARTGRAWRSPAAGRPRSTRRPGWARSRACT